MTQKTPDRSTLKHLAGRHPQKRHGWRYGSSFSGKPSSEFESEEERSEFQRRSQGTEGVRALAWKARSSLRKGLKEYYYKKEALDKELATAQKDALYRRQDMEEFSRESREIRNKIDAAALAAYHHKRDVLSKISAHTNAIKRGKPQEFIDRKKKLMEKSLEKEKALLFVRDELIKEGIALYGENPELIESRLRREFSESQEKVRTIKNQIENLRADTVIQNQAALIEAKRYGKRKAAVDRKALLRKVKSDKEKVYDLKKQLLPAWNKKNSKDKDIAAEGEKEHKKITAEIDKLEEKIRSDGQKIVMTKLIPKTPMNVDNISVEAKPASSFSVSRRGEVIDQSRITAGYEQHQKDIYSGLRNFARLIGNHPAAILNPPQLIAGIFQSDFLGAYSQERNEILVEIDPMKNIQRVSSVVVHEMAHWLEWNDPFILYQVVDLLRERTAGNDRGWEMRRDGITFHPDHFIDWYTGRLYIPSGTKLKVTDLLAGMFSINVSTVNATEILSTGLEMMYMNPVRLATEDPDMFDTMLSIMRMDEE